jgi:hypothetical protein
MSRIYVCREGIAGSAMPLNEGVRVVDVDWAALAGLGLTLAADGQRYLKRVYCPVNGDGYEYHRVELLDSNGCLVGSRAEE